VLVASTGSSHRESHGPKIRAWSCVGSLLNYTNGHRDALGECRDRIARSVRVTTPSRLLLKPAIGQGWYPEV
jgi:hypothetical protein